MAPVKIMAIGVVILRRFIRGIIRKSGICSLVSITTIPRATAISGGDSKLRKNLTATAPGFRAFIAAAEADMATLPEPLSLSFDSLVNRDTTGSVPAGIS